jgi:hypothetical protein
MEGSSPYAVTLEAEEKIVWFCNINKWIVVKNLKFLDRHELSRLSFAVLGPPFELTDALSLGVFPDRQA